MFSQKMTMVVGLFFARTANDRLGLSRGQCAESSFKTQFAAVGSK
jgi:hypothetical protein